MGNYYLNYRFRRFLKVVKALIDLPSADAIKETCEHLNSLLKKIDSKIEILQDLELPSETWDTLLIFIAASKVDSSIGEWDYDEWEEELEKMTTHNIPPYETFKTFLKRRILKLKREKTKKNLITSTKLGNKKSTSTNRPLITDKSASRSSKEPSNISQVEAENRPGTSTELENIKSTNAGRSRANDNPESSTRKRSHAMDHVETERRLETSTQLENRESTNAGRSKAIDKPESYIRERAHAIDQVMAESRPGTSTQLENRESTNAGRSKAIDKPEYYIRKRSHGLDHVETERRYGTSAELENKESINTGRYLTIDNSESHTRKRFHAMDNSLMRDQIQDQQQGRDAAYYLKCFYCFGNHHIAECKIFDKFTPYERRDAALKASLCFICLHRYHKTGECQSKRNCYVCGKKHHTKLHL